MKTILTNKHNYIPFGTIDTSQIQGYYYYKLLKPESQYHAYFKFSDEPSEQRIVTTYNYNQRDWDRSLKQFWIGCIPNADSSKNNGYDIEVKIDGKLRTDFTYDTNVDGYINFDEANIEPNTFIEIKARSKTGLLKENTISKYELPLSWDKNQNNEDIPYVSERVFTTLKTTWNSKKDLLEKV